MAFTAYQAKYFAHEILCRSEHGVERISQSLFNAKVDLNPHQIDAALFALKNPLGKGVLLADEVGLGKTVEAGLVFRQLWAERKRKLLVICPAVLRKQWVNELEEKFAIPCIILDSTVLRKEYRNNLSEFLNANVGKKAIVISYHYATKLADFLAGELWDCVIMDEAHKLRNAHHDSNKMGQALRVAFSGRKKLLLTATPLQNSLIELYGLSTILDEHLFGDDKVFRREFIINHNVNELKERLKDVVKRTLRKDVLEYIRYTKRHALTQNFYPSDEEQALYQAISDFIAKENSIALPKRQRHLIGLILRKLLGSSPYAIADTLTIILKRLYDLKEKQTNHQDLFVQLGEQESDLLESLGAEEEEQLDEKEEKIIEKDHKILNEEISQIENFIYKINKLSIDSKVTALLTALHTGFAKMAKYGAAQKAIIFTESVRTQAYLYEFLQNNGYADKVVSFSGSNHCQHHQRIYQDWLHDERNTDLITGSKQVDMRTALIDYFKHKAQIMIATEAAAEGVNLQFCSLLINYDLPWNPQRVEQRIGRCHRYGQQFDVVVINFLNQRNEADQRVLELLGDKFKLFDGVFGASDEVLGRIESGLNFEKRINCIYDSCRSSEEIQRAFDDLQREMEKEIQAAMQEANSALCNHFDEDVRERLKIQLTESQALLDKTSNYFWQVTKFSLQDYAHFNEEQKSFYLHHSPLETVKTGLYQLQKKDGQVGQDYRLNHPLGEWCLEYCKALNTGIAYLQFDYRKYPSKLSVIEQHQGQSGWLWIDKLGFYGEKQIHEQLVFTTRTDDGKWLDEDFSRKLLSVSACIFSKTISLPEDLSANAKQAIEGNIGRHSLQQTELLKRESERLDKWAEDKIKAVEQLIEGIRQQMNQIMKEKHQASNKEQLIECENQLKGLDKQRRTLRYRRDAIEDEINEQRDQLIDKIKQQISQQTKIEHLFAIRWQIL